MSSTDRPLRVHRFLSRPRRALPAIVVAATVTSLPLSASAALPIFAGPGEPPAQAGYVAGVGAIEVNNLGVVIGTGRHYTSDFSSYIAPFRSGANVTSQELLLSPGNPFSPAASVFAYGINRAGTSIASNNASTAGASRGLRYAPGSTSPDALQPIVTASIMPAETAAYDINDAGVVAGYADAVLGNIDLGQRAVVWAAGTTAPTQLKTIQTGMGRITENATRINEAGVISGNAIHYKPGVTSGAGVSQGVRPVRWASATADPVELQLINARTDGFSEGDVYDMNEGGTTVGVSHRYSGMTDLGVHAARWDAGGTAITELLTPAGVAARYSQSEAYDVNGTGTAIGVVFDPTLAAPSNSIVDRRVVRWAAGSNLGEELAPLGTTATGVAYSYSRSINRLGHTVGFSATAGDANGQYAAVVWKAGTTTPLNLNTLIDPSTGWYFTTASAISDTGFVTGGGAFKAAGSSSYYTKAYTILMPQFGTYGLGDADFDTLTNFNDLVILAQHYNQTNPTQNINVADFDLNGVTDFNDLVTLAQNYNSGGPSLAGAAGSSFDPTFAADWALAQSLVPEPTAVVLAGGLLIALQCSCRTKTQTV